MYLENLTSAVVNHGNFGGKIECALRVKNKTNLVISTAQLFVFS
jgi:hypothetical protein